jgi:hypothetical protein
MCIGINPSLCSSVTISNTGSYLATFNGTWQGNDGFLYAAATFSLVIADVSWTTEAYQEQMSFFYSQLQTAGKRAAESNLGVSLLLWMTFAISEDGGSDSFALTGCTHRYTVSLFNDIYSTNFDCVHLLGSPEVIFGRDYASGSFSNQFGDCALFGAASFSSVSSNLQVIYDYEQYLANDECMNITTPYDFGYNTLGKASEFEVKMDVRTLVTALAINEKLVNTSILEVIPDTTITVLYKGMYYDVINSFNPKFSGMAPLTCFTNISQCIFNIGTSYGIPIFNHYGNSTVMNCSYFYILKLFLI